jgi:hypothetical protein
MFWRGWVFRSPTLRKQHSWWLHSYRIDVHNVQIVHLLCSLLSKTMSVRSLQFKDYEFFSDVAHFFTSTELFVCQLGMRRTCDLTEQVGFSKGNSDN